MKYPKTKPHRDGKYLRLIASMPCFSCGIDGYSQAAHSNLAKHAVLVLCDCQESRSEIDHDTRKKALFDSKIRLPYLKWVPAMAPEWMEEHA